MGAFFEERLTSTQSYYPSTLHHIYVKLDFNKKYENADTTKDATAFLSSVTKASILTHRVAVLNGGQLIEIQGSLLHIVLPVDSDVIEFTGQLNCSLNTLFKDRREKVQGWRMIADSGNTLLVNGQSIHGDESTVSLGNAANRPAKRLYKQFSIPENERTLKRGCLEIRTREENWKVIELNKIPLTINFSIKDDQINEIKNKDYSGNFRNILKHETIINASATPIGSPTSDAPHISWGWILRADLDGFTDRVSKCYDNNEELTKLATEFVTLMNAAASFANEHHEIITQLPWAGDNFNAVANYSSKSLYEAAVEENLIGLSVDFEEDLHSKALDTGCSGWSQCVAGSYPHGNSNGNVYVSSIPVDGRNFLVGVGRGIGKSLQAMSDISPDVQELVLYNDDYSRIRDEYKAHFTPSEKNDTCEISALYKSANIKDLEDTRDDLDTQPQAIKVTPVTNSPVSIQTRPYFRG